MAHTQVPPNSPAGGRMRAQAVVRSIAAILFIFYWSKLWMWSYHK